MSDLVQAALELRKALQYYLETMDPEMDAERMIEIPTAFPEYAVGKSYKIKNVFRWGENAVGDPQLYQVLQDHTSSEEWPPDMAVSLYKKIGVSEEGYPEWVQPLGATDAYNTGDIVSHNEKLWRCTIDANVWEPGVYGWEEYAE